MSEFKFACPVCGQHITAGSSSSGTQITCPTCFQQIVVPQAPAGNDSKLILSAVQASRPRPTSTVPNLGPLRLSGSRASLVANVSLLVLLCAAAVVVYIWRAELMHVLRIGGKGGRTGQTLQEPTKPPPPQARWTLDPTQAVIPDRPPSGRLRGREFICERAIFAGGLFSMRQGRGWPPELALDILLSTPSAEQLNGKTIVITPGARSVVSKVILRWKDQELRSQQEEMPPGYALMLTFGPVTQGHMPGQVHVALPDADKSYVAGTFNAEIVKPYRRGK